MLKSIYEPHIMTDSLTPFWFFTDYLQNDERIYSHWHLNTEFLFCTEGKGLVYMDSGAIPMEAGDMVVVNSKHIHSIFSHKNIKYYCLIICNVFFKENGIDIEKLDFKEKIRDKKAEDLIKNIAVLFSGGDDDYIVPDKRKSILEYIIYMCKKYSSRKDETFFKNQKNHNAILDTIEYINGNFKKKITLDELARKAGYSKFHFARIFKETTGCTIIDHINIYRCEVAKNMLVHTNKPITQICIECGFEQSAYFSRTFKKIYGILPSEYRKRHSEMQL